MISLYEWKKLKESVAHPITPDEVDEVEDIEDEKDDPNPHNPIINSKIGTVAQNLVNRLTKLIGKRPSFFSQKSRALGILQPINQALFQASNENKNRMTGINRTIRSDFLKGMEEPEHEDKPHGF